MVGQGQQRARPPSRRGGRCTRVRPRTRRRTGPACPRSARARRSRSRRRPPRARPRRRRLDAGRRAQRLDRAHGVGARGAQPGSRRGVGHRGQLHRGAVPVAREHLAQDRVADLGGAVGLLPLEVLEPVAGLEVGRHQHVHVAVDGRGHHEAAVLGGSTTAGPCHPHRAPPAAAPWRRSLPSGKSKRSGGRVGRGNSVYGHGAAADRGRADRGRPARALAGGGLPRGRPRLRGRHRAHRARRSRRAARDRRLVGARPGLARPGRPAHHRVRAPAGGRRAASERCAHGRPPGGDEPGARPHDRGAAGGGARLPPPARGRHSRRLDRGRPSSGWAR